MVKVKVMRKILPLVIVLAFALAIEAGNSTVSYTAGQSTQIQTRLIPLFNKRHCAQFGQPVTCSSSDLTTFGGCVPVAVKGLTVDSCVIFASNAAGEQAFLQEGLNIHLTSLFGDLTRTDASDFCASFRVASTANQNSICATLGLPNGCVPCS